MRLRTIQKAKPERADARERGAVTYSTGRPCKNGHIADRFTVDASCCACRASFKESYRSEAARQTAEKRARMTPEQKAAYNAKQNAMRREDRKRDPEKYRRRERHHGRLKRQLYPKRKLAQTRARQIAKIQRTPPWADLLAIRRFYEACPPGMVVDHRIPIRGKMISGLHVVENLQYLTSLQNLTKGNSFVSESDRLN